MQTSDKRAEYLANLTVTTTSGEKFSGRQSAQLAFLVYKRFGSNVDSALAAYQRLMQSNVDRRSFEKLIGLDDPDVAEDLDRITAEEDRLFRALGF